MAIGLVSRAKDRPSRSIAEATVSVDAESSSASTAIEERPERFRCLIHCCDACCSKINSEHQHQHKGRMNLTSVDASYARLRRPT